MTPAPVLPAAPAEPRNALVRGAAAFYGCAVFLPVGMAYLGFSLVMLAMLVQGPRSTRLQRLRGHPLLWPILLYLGWTLVVLATQAQWYAETPSNLVHGLRIAATLLLAQMLSREEAVWALRAFVASAAVAAAVIAIGHTVGLPINTVTEKFLVYEGNKAISTALMLSVLAGSGIVVALQARGTVRWSGIAIALAALLCLLVSLPNRTSMLIIMLAAPAAALHQWRRQRLRIAIAVLATAAASALFITTVPSVRQNLLTGIEQVERGLRGEVARESWNLRVQMIRHTTDMIAEHPWMGWGIGAWNDQWRSRVPEFADINMPHNDFLWTGSQAGLPGALLWISIPLAACWIGWRRRDLTGRLAFVAALSMLCAALVNSAMRDGVIGLALLWIVGLYVRLANDPQFRLTIPYRHDKHDRTAAG
jgi:O-antigen ligase